MREKKKPVALIESTDGYRDYGKLRQEMGLILMTNFHTWI